MPEPRVVILGAGPAGLGAAYRLARDRRACVTVLERNSWVGGNTASFELAGVPVDFGSHRLHPAADPAVLGDIRALLGPDLLDRPRHGRIRLRGRWIHFPLKPLDLALKLPPSFAMGVARDAVGKLTGWWSRQRASPSGGESFASVLEAGLGQTICRDFYFPYAKKIWGLPPEQLSEIQAYRRVSASSFPRMARKVLAAVPGRKSDSGGRFLYPRRGYGQISEAYCRAAREAGADICLGAQVEAVVTEDSAVRSVRFRKDGQSLEIPADHVWSTIPITALTRCLAPAPPPEHLAAAEKIDYRAMILIYLVLDQPRFSEYDAHYFPELEVRVSRISEPKNFHDGEGPSQVTVLCAELPCAASDPEWTASDDDLGLLALQALHSGRAPVRSAVKQVVTRRLRYAYPICRKGYETHVNALDELTSGIDGLLTFGRQGLFSHDNLHHAVYMAYCAVECLEDDGQFKHERWQAFRRIFETHVVED
jgi:protoporphyrinogen oxidase